MDGLNTTIVKNLKIPLIDLNNQKIAIFIKAQSQTLAKIIKIKPEDKMAFDAFVVEIQRNMIRNKKGQEWVMMYFI